MANRLDTDSIQLRTVYARTPTNGFIPSSFVLISGGDGSTYWNSVSSLVNLSFTSIKGNTADTLYATLSNNLIQVSTTGIANTFQSYIDPVNSVLMLSNSLPPYIVSNGSVPTVNNTVANAVPNAQSLLQVTAQSSIKMLGVGDIRLSTINTQNAVFISISSFTSAGYSTISGETFAWRPTLYSTLSTAYNRPSFVSSIPYSAGLNGWNWGSNLPFSTSGPRDLYFSSITFNLDNIVPYIDVTRTSSSRIFIEYNPMLIMPGFIQGTESPIKEVSTFIQMENTPSGKVIFSESINTNYMVSQQFAGSANVNYFNPSLRFEINPYSSLLANYAANGGFTINLTIYHRFVDIMSNVATDTGFTGTPTMTNFTPKTGGLFVNLNNQSPTF
jgi:hypothetical protein